MYSSVGPFLTPFFYISVLFSLPFILFSKEFIAFFLPPEYEKSWFIISILGMLYVVYFFGKIPQLMFAKKTKIIFYVNMISISLNICLNIPLIKYFGFYGAAIATFFSGFITTMISLYFGQKNTPVFWGKRVFFYLLFLFFCFASVITFDFFELPFKIETIYKTTLIIFYLFLAIDCYKFVRKKSNNYYTFIEIIDKK